MAISLTPEYIRALVEEGVSQADIAREHGVTGQYVNKLLKKAGYVSSMTVINENMPWEVPGEFQSNTLYQYLRIIAHFNLGGWDEVKGDCTQGKLKTIVHRLHVFNQVIDFDPSYPAIPGVVNTPGFAYVPRSEEDADLVIKVRPGVTLTNIGQNLWKLPPLSALD